MSFRKFLFPPLKTFLINYFSIGSYLLFMWVCRNLNIYEYHLSFYYFLTLPFMSLLREVLHFVVIKCTNYCPIVCTFAVFFHYIDYEDNLLYYFFNYMVLL